MKEVTQLEFDVESYDIYIYIDKVHEQFVINELTCFIEDIMLCALLGITIPFWYDIIDVCHGDLVSVLYSCIYMDMDMDVCRNALLDLRTGSRVVKTCN